MNNMLTPFTGKKYLSIETFRKNGQGVKTPVWFAQDGETLHVWTQAGSGKVKRIIRNSSVRVAPSTVSGEPLGDWIPAQAQTDYSPLAVKTVTRLMTKKYGLAFRIFDFLNRKHKATDLKIYFI
jgi:PPOX class probable F420-dependent enzyme